MKSKINFLDKFSFRKLLYNKKFTVPFSLFAAFALWLVIMIDQNPAADRTFTDIPVNINLENTYVSETGMEIIGDISAERFTVKVNGPSYVVSALNPSDISLYASAAAINAPGKYQLEISGSKSLRFNDYEFVSISPSTVEVSFDYVDTKEFTIKARADGVSAAEGLIAENPVVSGTQNDTVTIKGPRTIINRIDSVVAHTTVNKTLIASTSYDADIFLYDENGMQIDKTNLYLSENEARVTIPISKRATVPVHADFTNLPKNFPKASIKYTVDHATVDIIGVPEAVDKIKNITLSPIDITSISLTSKSFDVSPKLPEGVRLLDSIESFEVTIDTSGYAERMFNVSNVKYYGLSAGLKAGNDLNIIRNVKICGPRVVINTLTADMLYAEIDLSEKAEGEHTVLATFKSEKYANIWQVGTYTTTVKIK